MGGAFGGAVGRADLNPGGHSMTAATMTDAKGPSWWVDGDWNGFFGLFTNGDTG